MRESFDYWLQIECPLCGSNKTYAHEDGDGQIDIIMCAACHRETEDVPDEVLDDFLKQINNGGMIPGSEYN